MDKCFCVFGDSVTHAAYVKVGWVELLRRYLEEKFSSDFVEVYNLGIGGNTTADILTRFDAEASARNPSSIIFATGVNDSGCLQDPSNPVVEKEKFISNIQELINRA